MTEVEHKIEQLAGDRLTKKLVNPGTGETPPPGSTVDVHYVGKLLDGSEFDSSRARREPISFVLGKGRVIAGLDRGVQTMRVGEKAILTIAPEFGYGSKQFGTIPPDSTLVFELEVLRWVEPLPFIVSILQSVGIAFVVIVLAFLAVKANSDPAFTE